MQISVTDVKKWAGREEHGTLQEPWPEALQERVPWTPDGDAHVAVRLRNTGEALLCRVSGTARFDAECGRCLGQFSLVVPFQLEEEFKEGAAPPDSDGEIQYYTGNRLDLDEMVSDAVAVAFPIAPICDLACRGLCPTCGQNRNLGDCACEDVPADDRWSALARLKFPHPGDTVSDHPEKKRS